MQTLNLQRLSVAAAVMAALYGMPVTAQTTANSGDELNELPLLEEIVITAQKRTEKLEDIPVSAAVISSDTILNTNASDISDLNKLVPSVNLNGSFNGRVPMGIRGISSVSNEATVGLSSGVAILIDGVPVPSDSMGGNQLEDIQSVEVLKGPQATLGGRTAATGVINIVTRKPSDTFTGDVSATATDDSEYRLSGFLSGPIANRLDFSLSAYGSQRDQPIKNIQLDKKTEQKTSGVRGKLMFKPTDDLDITLMARYGKMTSDGFNFVYGYVSPGATLLGVPAFVGVTTQQVLLPGITPSFDNQQYSSPHSVASNIQDRDASLNIEYRLGDLTLGSITAYQHETQDNSQDLFAVATYFWNELTGAPGPTAPPPFYNTQSFTENIKQFSQEFKLASPADQTFSYLVGLFYSDTKVEEQQTRDFIPAYANFKVTPVTKTYDIYARTTWKFLPETSLVTGLRYNYDKLSYTDNQYLYTFSFDPNVPANTVILANQNASDSSSSSTVVGDASLQQRFGENSMVYATYARGYSPGAYNTAQSIDTIQAGNTTSRPKLDLVAKETVDHFEIGSKNNFANRVTLNVSIFDTIYKNFQIQNFDKNSVSINPPLILTAVGKAETRGVEVDTRWAATTTLKLDFNAAYIDAKFKDYDGAPCYYPEVAGQTPPGCYLSPGTSTTIVQNLSGKTMPNSPKFKAVLSAEQRVPVGSNDLVFAGNYSYRSSADRKSVV